MRGAVVLNLGLLVASLSMLIVAFVLKSTTNLPGGVVFALSICAAFIGFGVYCYIGTKLRL